MILSKCINVTISSNGRYYRNLGYGNCKQGDVISVRTEHLPKNSNKLVNVRCDNCYSTFERKYQGLNKQKCHLCFSCSRKKIGESNKGNSWGFKSRNMSKENHPRWNPNKDDFSKYRSEVIKISGRQPLYLLENYDKPRTRCGVEGGYQLDHKVSIKEGYDKNIPPHVIGNLTNLQFIPWEENRRKGIKKMHTIQYNTFVVSI